MAAIETQIGGEGTLFVGEDKPFEFECLDGPDEDTASAPVDMTGWTLLFDVRKKDTSAEPAILSLTPTVVGVYNPVRAFNTQRAHLDVTDDQMNLFKAANYRWSIKRMDNGLETVIGFGTFAPQKATAP